MSEQIFNNHIEKPDPLNTPLDEVQMSLQLLQLLEAQGITTLGDILEKGEAYFTFENKFNPRMKTELEIILKENNLSFI